MKNELSEKQIKVEDNLTFNESINILLKNKSYSFEEFSECMIFSDNSVSSTKRMENKNEK